MSNDRSVALDRLSWEADRAALLAPPARGYDEPDREPPDYGDYDDD